ncbi:YciI family protein [Kutzneria sp. CA-103260]|uniref:YciI family protein n=1 Tax=Kutzneria sp. CA-103260 TaxID=2802641 RepID=UPI001BAC48B1|nr:YciI family protein [Kutzneria sp. CA-103260]QUQ68871.1 YCII-related domain protein [Kutzneria sp. CA-103260]
MAENHMSWPDLVDWSRQHDLLAKQLYVIISEPTDGIGPVLDNLDDHVAYQTRLEQDGVMFGAGPLADEAERAWLGAGIFIYRAESRSEAVKLAESDPMHARGARTFTVRLWLLNEGTYSVQLFYSGGRPRVI